MFQTSRSRTIVSVDYRMMMHAFVASWGSTDPYFQNGAALCVKDVLRGSACSSIVGDSYFSNKIRWDDPNIYDYVVPAEMKLLDVLFTEKFDTAVYVTTVPHPLSVKLLIDKGIKRIVYYQKRTPLIPKNYRKVFEKIVSVHHNLKIEPYLDRLHWVRDKLDLMEQQIPDLFS